MYKETIFSNATVETVQEGYFRVVEPRAENFLGEVFLNISTQANIDVDKINANTNFVTDKIKNLSSSAYSRLLITIPTDITTEDCQGYVDYVLDLLDNVNLVIKDNDTLIANRMNFKTLLFDKLNTYVVDKDLHLAKAQPKKFLTNLLENDIDYQAILDKHKISSGLLISNRLLNSYELFQLNKSPLGYILSSVIVVLTALEEADKYDKTSTEESDSLLRLFFSVKIPEYIQIVKDSNDFPQKIKLIEILNDIVTFNDVFSNYDYKSIIYTSIDYLLRTPLDSNTKFKDLAYVGTVLGNIEKLSKALESANIKHQTFYKSLDNPDKYRNYSRIDYTII